MARTSDNRHALEEFCAERWPNVSVDTVRILVSPLARELDRLDARNRASEATVTHDGP